MFLRKMGSLAMMFAAVGLIACSGDSSKSVAAPAVEEDSGKTALPDSVKVDPTNHDANPSQGVPDEKVPVAPGIIGDDEAVGESNVIDDDDEEDVGVLEDTQEPTLPEVDDPVDVSSGTSFSSGKYSCTVTSTSNSVKVDQRIEGVASYVSTVSGRDGRLSIETEMWYADADFAEEFCDDWKKEAEYWNGSMTVTCSSNTIKTSEYDEGSLSGHQKDFEELCEEGKEQYEDGEYDEYI
ncbi:MAG: hypothetical protein J6U20_01125 [Fibrobacter sp.]|nr:hypothetical protein [Fibrobacter sp.]